MPHSVFPHARRHLPLAAAALLVAAGAPAAGTTARAAAAVASLPGTAWSTVGELANASGQDAYLGSTGGYQWIVLQESEYRDVAAIKAANPNTKVLAYEDVAVTEGPNSCQYDNHPAAGVSYCYANANHPEWFLTGSGGSRLVYGDFPSDYAMDIGSGAYQQSWESNVATVLQRDGWDGVFMDDVNTYPGHSLDGKVARYTDVQYGQAMVSFVDSVAPALRSAGLLTVGNVAADPWNGTQESLAEQMAGSIGGFFREFWQRWGAGTALFTGSMWSSLMAQAERVQSQGAFYLANTYGAMTDTAAMAFARASFLLAWNGQAGGASFWDAGLTVPYSGAWTASIGTPIGGRYQVGAGWERAYSGGVALVNPSPTTAQTFPLSGSYTTSSGAPVSGAITLQPGTGAVLVAPNSSASTATTGYWEVAADGGIFAFGTAQFHGSTGSIRLNQPIVGMAATPSGRGYWLVASDGGIFAFGDAQFRGSTGNIRLNQPIVGMAPARDGGGYWLVAADGGIFAFGDAQFHGSTGNIRLNQPIVGMAATPTGNGYWLVARDGGIFAFGDARFHGSTGNIRLNQPIAGMAATATGNGYWLVATDGGIFAFGDAPFYGSTGNIRLNQPIVAMAATPTGNGYWLEARDGGIFAFGQAPFLGSMGGSGLNQPVISLAGAGG